MPLSLDIRSLFITWRCSLDRQKLSHSPESMLSHLEETDACSLDRRRREERTGGARRQTHPDQMNHLLPMGSISGNGEETLLLPESHCSVNLRL